MAPPPSASFIRLEDFDEHFPESKAPNNNIGDNTQQTGNQPTPFTFSAPSQKLPVTVITSTTSEAGGSSTSSSTSELGSTNWIGKLLEYIASRRGAPPAQFIEETLPTPIPRFVCFVTINESPTTFGSRDHSFARKKDAKQHAAKLAVEWLTANGYMGPRASPVAAIRPSTNLPTAPAELSAGAKVAELCLDMGMAPPKYVIESDPATPMLWSGYAHFPQEGRVTGRIGEFENVFGRKNAKEQCVLRVLEFLEGVRRHRMGLVVEI